MIVLDASALLALLFREAGHEKVADVLGDSAMSVINLAEVLNRFARDGHSSLQVLARLQTTPIDWIDFNPQQAALTAELLPRTKHLGLSLGDRACLALASTLGVSALTADAAWAELDVGIDVKLIR